MACAFCNNRTSEGLPCQVSTSTATSSPKDTWSPSKDSGMQHVLACSPTLQTCACNIQTNKVIIQRMIYNTGFHVHHLPLPHVVHNAKEYYDDVY